MYEVTVMFDNKEKVPCVRDTFSKAKFWANQIIRYGSVLCENVVTELTIKLITGGEKE